MGLPSNAIDKHGRPVLHLSGPKLTMALETLVGTAENLGGIEALVRGLTFKTGVFQEVFQPSKIDGLDRDTFLGLTAFMAPVRRRIGPWLESAAPDGMETVKHAIRTLLEEATRTAEADDALRLFQAQFPGGKAFRWVRDLAAEILHNAMPEQYPLMTRWVWDSKANTGVIREIWHADDIDRITLDVPDTYQTFLVLREELSQFLTDNGVFRDMGQYVDLICAQIYANYVSEQGGTYLRTEFSAAEEPTQYTRRMLGLDGIDPETGRTRAKGTKGRPIVLDVDAANNSND